MDIEKAIDILSNFDMQVTAKADGAYQSTIGEKACKYAVEALEELQQYRQIGTVDECRAAMEKQIPKKVRFKTKNSVSLPCCPNCGETYCDCSGGENYCKNCGQKWEWGE